jgi:carboxyl-terminal processing protease
MLIGLENLNGTPTVVVEQVFPNTPAEEGGVIEGDRIVSVDTVPTAGASLDKVSNMLRGPVGSQVNVTYLRPGVAEPLKLHFTRREVHVPAVNVATMLKGNVGYVSLQTFNENAADEVATAVEKLEQQGAKGIVLDMRDNGGGIVDQALAVSGLFLQEGQEIVSVRARNAPNEVARARGPHLGSNIPLVVLVDGSSASATEIVAGALQDHDRALIVGTTSFGKGLVQSVFPLDGGYFLKMTTGKWYTPSGRSIHRDRQLLADGRFVETHPDSLETDSARKTRPVFRSDAGRVVYGGGGIAPDVIVTDDTLPTIEQQFLRAIAPKGQIVQSALDSYAFELKGTVTRDFVVSPSWTTELMRRLTSRGLTIEPRFDAAANRLFSRELEHRVARMAFGDAFAKERELKNDRQLAKAMELLERSGTQRELFTVAHAGIASRH